MRLSLTKQFSSPRRRWQIFLACLVLIVINLTSSMVYQNYSKPTSRQNISKPPNVFKSLSQESKAPELPSLIEPKTISYHEIPPEILETVEEKDEPETDTENSSNVLTAEMLPEIVNPWFQLSENKDDRLDLSQDEYENATLNSCSYRTFKNNTVYGHADFVHDYIKFKKCIGRAKLSPLDKWIHSNVKAELGNKGEMVITTKFKTRQNNVESCSADQEIKLLIMAVSNSKHERDNIRKTWAKVLPNHVKLVFLTHASGNTEEYEEKLVQTIVDPDDEYHDFKQMVILLSWVDQHCPRARFVLKTSSDIFVNVPKMLQLVDQEMYASNRMYGELLRRMGPAWPDHRDHIKDKTNHHIIAKSEWPWPKFPPILKGPSYIISGDLVPRMLMASTVIPALPLAQVYFTGLVSLLGHMMRIGVSQFFAYEPPSKESVDICDYYKFGAIHGMTDLESMRMALEKVEEATLRNETCTVPPRCLAMVEGKCMMFSKNKPETKKTGFNWP